MHQNLPFWTQKSKTNWRGAWIPPHTPSMARRGHPLLTLQPLGDFSASFLALAMIRPPLFKPWIRPWVSHQSVSPVIILSIISSCSSQKVIVLILIVDIYTVSQKKQCA